MDKILGCGIDDIHVMTNWKKAEERLEAAKKKEYVLVTGGLGYIGSHTIIELIEKNNDNIIIIDNLDNSRMTCLERIKHITGKPDNLGSIKLISGMNLHWKTPFSHSIRLRV